MSTRHVVFQSSLLRVDTSHRVRKITHSKATLNGDDVALLMKDICLLVRFFVRKDTLKPLYFEHLKNLSKQNRDQLNDVGFDVNNEEKGIYLYIKLIDEAVELLKYIWKYYTKSYYALKYSCSDNNIEARLNWYQIILINRVSKTISKYLHLINITFGTLLDQPKTHYMEELAIQRKENGPCDMFETSKCESKHKFYRQ